MSYIDTIRFPTYLSLSDFDPRSHNRNISVNPLNIKTFVIKSITTAGKLLFFEINKPITCLFISIIVSVC